MESNSDCNEIKFESIKSSNKTGVEYNNIQGEIDGHDEKIDVNNEEIDEKCLFDDEKRKIVEQNRDYIVESGNETD